MYWFWQNSCKAVVVAVLLMLMMWPAIYNGQPIFNTDTTAYIRGADAAIAKLTGHDSVWGAKGRMAAADLEQAAPSLFDPEKRDFVTAGRSVYYGALLYFGDALGYLWPSIVVQAAAVLLALGLTLYHIGSFSCRSLALVTVGLAALSPLPFFVSDLSPDLFAGVAILAMANFIAFGGQMTRSVWCAWLMLLAAALSFHASHALIAVAMLCFVLTAGLLRKPIRKSAIVALVSALALAGGAEFAFTQGVKKVLGVTPTRPPFLMARLIADGPGAAYLKANCPQAGFTVCSFVDRLPVGDADAFLWSTDPSRGVFMNVDAAMRQALSNEQLRFALATLAFDPVGEIKAAAKNVFTQLGLIGRINFTYVGDTAFYRAHVPSPYIEAMERTKTWSGDLPMTSLPAVAFIVASMIFILASATFRRSQISSGLSLFTVAVILGVLFNATVCGAMSGPHDRYQARVIWLIPLAALLFAYRRRAKDEPANLAAAPFLAGSVGASV